MKKYCRKCKEQLTADLSSSDDELSAVAGNSSARSSSSFIRTNNSHIEFITTEATDQPPSSKVIKWVNYSTNSQSIIREAHVYRYMQLNWPEDPMSSLALDIVSDKRKGFTDRCGFVMRPALGDLGHYICCDKMKSDVIASSGIEQAGAATVAIQPDYLLMCILLSLFRLHAGGIVHRDVKPGNILIDKPANKGSPPTIIVADFGNSSVVRGFDLMRKKYTSETCTKVYAPPEDASGAPLEYSFDIWCAAATMVHYMRYSYYVHNLRLSDPKTFETIARNRSDELAVTFDSGSSRCCFARAEIFSRMLQAMVHPDPACRPSAETLLLDSFFHETCKVAGMPPTHAMMGLDVVSDNEQLLYHRHRRLYVGPPALSDPVNHEVDIPHAHEHGFAELMAREEGQAASAVNSPIKNLVHYVASQLGSREITYRTVLYMLHWLGESGMCNTMKNIIGGNGGNGGGSSGKRKQYITKKQGQIVTACFMVVYMCTEEELLDVELAVETVCNYIKNNLPEGTYKTPVYKAFAHKTLHALAKHIFFTQFQCVIPLQFVS